MRHTTDCGECGGAGYLWRDAWGSGGHYTLSWECPSCDGSGQVEAEPDYEEELPVSGQLALEEWDRRISAIQARTRQLIDLCDELLRGLAADAPTSEVRQ
jgi:hypothetical protein